MENASEAIYLGIYTMIFVIALSLTVFLFSSMLDYSEDAYEYMHSLGNDAVIVNAPANRHLLINGQDVISYYYNYIKKDSPQNKYRNPSNLADSENITESLVFNGYSRRICDPHRSAPDQFHHTQGSQERRQFQFCNQQAVDQADHNAEPDAYNKRQ